MLPQIHIREANFGFTLPIHGGEFHGDIDHNDCDLAIALSDLDIESLHLRGSGLEIEKQEMAPDVLGLALDMDV